MMHVARFETIARKYMIEYNIDFNSELRRKNSV